MEVAVCCLNSKYIHASLAPWCLKAGVSEYCSNINCTVVESTINADLDEPLKKLIYLKPKVVGFCSYIWNIDKTIELAQKFKAAMPNTVIVFGGPEVSYRAEAFLMEYSFVDYVVSGEGERPFAALCEHIKNDAQINDISGVSYRNGKNIINTKPNIENGTPPSPYCDEFFEVLGGRISYIESSRGCPYSCAFCLSGRCGSVRYFDIEKTKEEIINLSNSGTKTVKFVDRTFNANSKRAVEIWQFIIDNYGKTINKDVCFHFEIAGDILTDDAIKLLARAPIGLIQLEIGMQSFNEKTLEAIHRKTNISRLKDNIKRLIEPRNIHIHIDLIAGLPYEDLKSLKNSFNIAYGLRADMLQFGFLKLLHGAPMREEPQNYPCEYEKAAPYTVISTPWLSQREIVELKKFEDAFDRIYGSGRFKFTLRYLTEVCKVDPFELFYYLGNELEVPQNTPLNEYVEKLYTALSNLKVCDKKILRDLLAADKLVSDKSGKLPEILKVKDKAIKKAKTYVRGRLGNTASALIIYTNEAALHLCDKSAPIIMGVNYNIKDELANRYKAEFFILEEINC